MFWLLVRSANPPFAMLEAEFICWRRHCKARSFPNMVAVKFHFLRLIDSPKWFAKFKIALIIAVYWLKCLKLRANMLGI